MYDFSNIHLTFKMRVKLSVMRLKKRVAESFLGSDRDYLTDIQFVRRNFTSKKNEIGESIPDGTYSLTFKYQLYLAYRHEKAFYAVLSSVFMPIIVSVITSVLTVLLLRRLGLQ